MGRFRARFRVIVHGVGKNGSYGNDNRHLSLDQWLLSEEIAIL